MSFTVQHVFFTVELPSLVLRERPAIRPHLFVFLTSDCALLTFQVLRLRWAEAAVTKATPNAFLLMFFTTIALWMPVINLLLVWAAWKDRTLMPPSWLKWVKYLFWAALAVNAALVLAMVLEPYLRGEPEY